MRRSSGMGGGARMFRSMGRAVAAGVRGNLPATNKLSDGNGARVVDATSSRVTVVAPLIMAVNRLIRDREDEEWENVAADEEGSGFGDRRAFGPAPTVEEAEEAISTIQKIFPPITFSRFSEVEYFSFEDENALERVALSADIIEEDDCSTESESESDWIEPVMHLYRSRAPNNIERENILYAFLMLQTNQPFKRMVASLSSDPAVWDAVMKNEVVQELKASFYEAESSGPSSKDEEHAEGILRWILKITKGKIMDFFDKISKLANDIFRSHENDEEVEDAYGSLLGASVIFSIVVFIIVVATRIQNV